jgi:hypothetical protein
MKPGFSRRAQIAENSNDCVCCKFSIDALLVQNLTLSPRMFADVQNFETIMARVPATRRSPYGQIGRQIWAYFPPLRLCRGLASRTLAFA